MLFPYTLGVVVIMKNEAPYVKEWLDYHLNAGVDIVYLYDNDSTDNLEEKVLPYIKSGRVIYHKIPGDYKQLPCYHDALQKYRFLCKYLAFIDADEFIYPTNNGSIKDFVENYFKDKENVGGLLISWYLFGSNGEEKADLSRGVLERFKRRGVDAEYTCKSIVNPRLVFDFNDSPHQPLFFNSISDKDEFGNPYFDKEKFSGKKIFVAHYAVKSKEEYLNRLAAGDAFYKQRRNITSDGKINAGEFNYKDKNEVYDVRVYEYYLNNLKNPYFGRNKIEDCLAQNFEILKSKNINMEEYLSLYHIYTECRNFLNKQSQNMVDEYLKKALKTVVDNTDLIREAELFVSDAPYLIKNNSEREKIKKIALYYYDFLENTFLANKNFPYAMMLRINKKWLDLL